MDLFAAINPLLVVSGFVVGMLVGLTGVGGGSLMTPILVLLFGVHATTAVGTDLLYAAITKTGGTLTHGLKGTVDWRVTGRLAAGSIPATILTLAGEDSEHLAVSRRIRVDREGAVSGEQPRNIEPYDLPSAGVDLRIVVDMTVVASVPEAHPNPHLVCAPVIAD